MRIKTARQAGEIKGNKTWRTIPPENPK